MGFGEEPAFAGFFFCPTRCFECRENKGSQSRESSDAQNSCRQPIPHSRVPTPPKTHELLAYLMPAALSRLPKGMAREFDPRIS